MKAKPAPRQVFAQHIFSAKPQIDKIYPPFNSRQCKLYENHFGSVLAVSKSPFNERLFLTCSTDGTIRLYDIIEKRPVAVFEPSHGETVNCVAWSLQRPAVFACTSASGNLFFYDLVLSQKNPSLTIEMDDFNTTPANLREATSIMFNPVECEILAVAYHDQTVRVFQLSAQLTTKT